MRRRLLQVYVPAARPDTVYVYMSTYLQFRKKFKAGRTQERVLTDCVVEPSMLTQQRNSLQQLQDDQRCWENEVILKALEGQKRLHEYKQITNLISIMESNKTARARMTYQDRGGAHFDATYSHDQSLALSKAGLFTDVAMPFARDIQRQAIEHHLDTILSEKNCGRSELIRDAQLPDVHAHRPPPYSPDVWRRLYRTDPPHTFQTSGDVSRRLPRPDQPHTLQTSPSFVYDCGRCCRRRPLFVSWVA